MTGLNLTYSYDRPNCESEIIVIDSFFEKDSLLITASETGSNGDDEADAYIDRQDAIDLAWSILEHYGVTERPQAPLAVGDFVAFENGELGKVVKVDSDEPALFVEDMNGHCVWRYTEDATRITKEELVQKATEKAHEQVNKLTGEN